ncbi:MAG: TatD family deoxyribonuclease [Calditrichales bacterium]|nr:MAG: TatD family deoxyribonuclease [Calditrichales bacterium]
MIIDTHTHLHFDSFDEDREQVVQRAIKNDIDAMITIGTDVATSRQSIELAHKFAVIYAAVGIHPNDSSNVTDEDFDQILELAKEEKVVAIGEVGLDYYRMYSPKEKQFDTLRRQVKLARKLGLPLIIHNREANEDILNVLNEEKADEVGGVFHSFTGDIHFLDSVLALNYLVSFTGPVTFRHANYNQLIDRVPLSQLLLETDSPFLAPDPFRGKRNEPAYVRYIAEKISQIKGVSVDDLADITSENTQTLFRLKDQWQLKLKL